MKDMILNYIKKHKEVTMADLCRNIQGFSGDYIWYNDSNLVIWDKCSQESVNIMQELLLEFSIYMKPMPLLTFIAEGEYSKYPMINVNNEHYSSLHWFPVSFVSSPKDLPQEILNIYIKEGIIKPPIDR